MLLCTILKPWVYILLYTVYIVLFRGEPEEIGVQDGAHQGILNILLYTVYIVLFRGEPEESGVQDGPHQRHDQRTAEPADWPGRHPAAGAAGQCTDSLFFLRYCFTLPSFPSLPHGESP